MSTRTISVIGRRSSARLFLCTVTVLKKPDRRFWTRIIEENGDRRRRRQTPKKLFRNWRDGIVKPPRRFEIAR
jgi:hypothetical protein